LRPVPAERVVEAGDGHVIDLAGRSLLCLDSPGHARHHMVIWDERSRSFFTGDTFGLSYRELDGPKGPFILPTTTPVQFEPDALKASIRRMLSFDPSGMYLTHFGRVEDVVPLAAALFEQIDAMVAIAREHGAADNRHQRITAALTNLYRTRALAHACPRSSAEVAQILAMDIELNAQGLEVWFDREARNAA
jgi:glyoxylase-like metal-dependent hydrolase (beta-lactamase superfamily II)